MRLGDLAKWGIPSRLIDIWRERQGDSLLPVQSRAVRKGLLGKPGCGCEYSPVHTIVSAPTSSGKSFCAELAAVKALMARRKTVMLFPLKSLVEQNYALFKETYGPLGVKCLIVTGDYPDNDKQFDSGDYHMAFVIYEKYDLLLTGHLDALKSVGLVAIDELQTVAEPGRGPILERLLTKILASVYEPSLVGLSAVIGDSAVSAGRLAEWLGATLIEEVRRPVDLLRGVAAEGSFRYRSYNSGLDGSDSFITTEAGDEPFEAFIRQLKSDGGSTLVFLKSRAETVQAAFKLAASVNWPGAKAALEKLDEEEPSFLTRSLRQALSRGVAFHNSDLSSKQRRIVEQAFISKDVTVMFSTTTLAMGVDLPADTVYLETVRYAPGEYGCRPALVPVSRSEFDNMTGRAGRLGRSKSRMPGRAIVLAESDFDRDILWDSYIAADNPEPINSALSSMLWEDWLLSMVVSGLARDVAGLEELLGRTLYARTVAPADRPDFAGHLRRLADENLLEITGEERHLAPTALGRAVARAGLSFRQTVYFLKRLECGHPETAFGWTALVLGGPDWALPPGILTRFEQATSAPLKMLYRYFGHSVDEAQYLLAENHLREPLSHRSAAALKSLLLLDQWGKLVPVQKLEAQFQVHLGQIMSLGDTVAHMISGVAALTEATDCDSPLISRLREYSFMHRTGMPASLQSLHRCFGQILNRADYAALQRAGIENMLQLRQATINELEAIIRGENKFKEFVDRLKSVEEETDMQSSSAISTVAQPVVGMPMAGEPELVEVDGHYDRERYMIRINGFPVMLTGKSFKYFAKLAWSRLNSESGWVYKEDLEVGFNQARYLYRMKNEISGGYESSWPVIENNRLGYYRLSLEPSKIRMNMERLGAHPDYEVSSLASGEGIDVSN